MIRISILAALIAAAASSPMLGADIPRLESVDPLKLPAPAAMGRRLTFTDTQRPEAKIVPRLWERIANSKGQRIPLIVELAEPVTTASAIPHSAAWDAQKADLVARMAHEFAPKAEAAGAKNLRALSHFPLLFADLESSRVLELARLPEVFRIYEDEILQPYRMEGGQIMRATALRNTYAARGAGIGVAVIDSGVAVTHPELFGKVTAEYDWTATTGSGVIDTTGHGTQVAGIVAGANGMAPLAHIWALRVCTETAGCPTNAVLSALNQAYVFRNDSRYGGLHIVNLSLGGGPPNNSDCDGASPFNTLLNSLYAAGISIFVAAGNEAYGVGVSHPACHSKAISVGAAYDGNIGPISFGAPTNCANPTTGPDQITCYSNWGIPLDIVAPAHCAVTTLPFGGYAACFGGTSAAAPYAAGVAAQILSVKPGTSPAALRDALASTGRALTGPNNVTRNRIDALAAYQLLSGVTSCTRTADTACLQGNRFEVKVRWQNTSGSGTGQLLAFGGQRAENDESAFFYFQTPSNFEMAVKVLNACVPALGNKYWLFASGLTDQGWTLTVRDTATNAVRTYSNATGHLSSTFGDISAFNCP